MKIMEIDGSNKRFWGMIVEKGKKYTQTVEQDFSLTMACLENKSDTKNQYVQLYLQYENTDFLLCTLQHGQLLQQKLDMSFGIGEELVFSTTGPGNVHLTGYLLDNPMDDEDNYDDDPDFLDTTNGEDLSEEDYSDVEDCSENDETEEEEDEDEPELVPAGTKRKAIADAKTPPKKQKGLNGTTTTDDSEDDSKDDDEDEEEEEDFSDDFEGDSFIDDEAEEKDSEDDEDDEDEEEKPETPKKKQIKEEKKTPKESPIPNKNQTPKKDKKAEQNKTPKSAQSKQEVKQEVKTPEPVASGDADTTSKKKKKKKKKNKEKEGTVGIPNQPQQNGTSKPQEKKDATNQQTPKSTPKPKKTVVQGGTTVEEIKEGHGPTATPGKMCGMYYAGTLLQGGKRFDSCLSGKPFKFKLGKGEVIKGWDAGVRGMKVGGKRRLTVPANQAYGSQRLPGIPQNSSLVFEVELKSVS